jgi:uncharacterized protein (TIGR02246 family)
MRALSLFPLLLGATAAALSAQQSPPVPRSGDEARHRDSAAVHQAVLRGGTALNARDPDAIIALYARDLVLSYPGKPDMGYDALARAMREMTSTDTTVLHITTQGAVDEVIVSGDLAVVRVVWTTTTTSRAHRDSASVRATRRMKDLQVWRREADRVWRFARGMHYRMTPPDRAGPAAGR